MTEADVRLAAGRSFAAPGKLMLAGEYSVLGPGGEALALAVDPGVLVTASPAADWELVRAEDGSRWRPGLAVPETLRFAHEAWTAAIAALKEPPSPHQLLCRTLGEIEVGDQKPGLGGSASAVAAVAAAVLGLAGLDLSARRGELLRVALDAHRRGQGGLGSGTDVAAVVHGGLVRFWPAEERALELPWPEGLELLAGYSGQSVSTRLLLRQVFERGGPDLMAALDELGRSAHRLSEAFAGGTVSEILEGTRFSQRALARFGRRRGLTIVTPALHRMIELAESVGAAAKVSGAGGGDSVVALAPHPSLREEVARRWLEQGFRPLCVASAREGAHEVSGPEPGPYARAE